MPKRLNNGYNKKGNKVFVLEAKTYNTSHNAMIFLPFDCSGKKCKVEVLNK